ncbi:methylated-DNA--[protein]-cysteine S-methyltransferase [Paenibacillus sp. YN15]|uniref:methylated-DNA--[protein]-cysteine S-methyltransferase n=1 Tax=Paenibacillus sp. YN15 TaxID=1742774 RepID=UPI000DCB2B03|nr:methylated-DNA--[protein]-cysteine S-methyltransferase [Paenibacillus sp. YN15]RAU91647.1 [Fe-S]-binding protein [Paenibacillus sp. YN15]
MSVIYYGYLPSPIGKLLVAATERGICRMDFDEGLQMEEELASLAAWAAKLEVVSAASVELVRDGGGIPQAVKELEEYFKGERTVFSVPLDVRGTPFQEQVWRALTGIPYGTVCSYKDIAMRIGSPKAVRAVGGANNRNPLPVIIPCHRVVGAAGHMVGYGGGLPIKEVLLRLEGAAVRYTIPQEASL